MCPPTAAQHINNQLEPPATFNNRPRPVSHHRSAVCMRQTQAALDDSSRTAGETAAREEAQSRPQTATLLASVRSAEASMAALQPMPPLDPAQPEEAPSRPSATSATQLHTSDTDRPGAEPKLSRALLPTTEEAGLQNNGLMTEEEQGPDGTTLREATHTTAHTSGQCACP